MSTLAVEARPAPPVPERRWTRGRIAAALVALWLLTGVYLVAPDQQAVETRFGTWARPWPPPWRPNWRTGSRTAPWMRC